MKSVNLETTIVSYLTARPSRDLINAARQQLTWEWWERRRNDFELFISQAVLDEAGVGDSDAAHRRLELLASLPVLDLREDAEELAVALLEEGLLPEKAVDDALPLALAAAHGIDFLLTWNCKHLANAELLVSLGTFLSDRDFQAPYVCTPDELLEQSNA